MHRFLSRNAGTEKGTHRTDRLQGSKSAPLHLFFRNPLNRSAPRKIFDSDPIEKISKWSRNTLQKAKEQY